MWIRMPSNVEINERALETIKKRIIEEVKQNINTKSKNDKEMVDKIRNLIIEEANKNY